MCGKNATTTTNTAPNPIAMGAYTGDISRAAGVAGLPFMPYGGEFTAPVNQQQQLAGANINQNAGFALPFIQQGAQYANAAAQPITAQQIANYQSPYTQQVINATEAQFNQQNAQQQSQLIGNAAAQGALGGDRVGIAQAQLAGQQQLQEAPVIAGLEQSGYNTALQTALAEQQAQAQGAYSLGNLGVAGQNAALQGAGAQLGYGGLQQQTQQALDTALYNQFLAQQAYPFQVAQWQAGIDTGVGSQMGGTSTTTGPAPNPFSQILGAGIGAAAAFWPKKYGGGIHRDAGGRIRGFAFGGMPYAGGSSYVPSINLTPGQGAPKPSGSSGQGQQTQNPIQQANQILGLSKNLGKSSLFGGADVSQNEAIQAGLDSGMDPEDFGPGILEGFRRGGRIAGFAVGGYADGGGPDDPDTETIYMAKQPWPAGIYAGDYDPDHPTPGFNASEFDIPQGSNYSPENYNKLQDYGTFSPDMPSTRPEAHVAPTPLPRPRPDIAPDLPPPVDVADRRIAGIGGPDLSGGRSQPASFAPAPEISAGQGEAPAKQSGFGGLFNNPLHFSDNVRQGLLAAGLGMMASRSPYLGVAIGEGGLAGLSAYAGAKKEEFNENKALQTLQQHADETAKRLANETKRIEQGEERLGIERERLEQGKFTMVPGMGTGPEGTPVPGAYKFNTKTGEPTFMPGVTPTGKGGAGAGTAFSDDTIKMMAQAIRAGNTQVLINLGAGAMKAENVARVWNKVAEMTAAEGGTGGDLAAARANFNAQMGAAKSQAVREANVAANIEEAKRTFPLAVEASDRLPRGQFVPWNQLVQMVQRGTSSPELAAFHTAIQGVITAYSQAMARAGVATVDGRHAAETLISTAQDSNALKAVLGQMSKEMDAAKAAPEQVRQEILSRISGRPAAPAGGGALPAGGGRSPVDQQALDWANANPNDPRAAQIKQRLGVQ